MRFEQLSAECKFIAGVSREQSKAFIKISWHDMTMILVLITFIEKGK